MSEYEQGYWNGLRVPIRKVEGRVRPWQDGDPRFAWWKSLVNKRVKAVEVDLRKVVYSGEFMYLYDEDGMGWDKVTIGRGTPRYGHNDIPLVDVTERTMEER